MRKNFGAAPVIYPLPVLILAAYDEHGLPNAMNAAWGGICGEKHFAVTLAPDRRTLKNALTKGEFTVSFGVASQVTACDYVGLESGNKVEDKFARAGFHAIKSEFIDAPLIAELPMALECKVIKYVKEEGRLIGEIVNVCADESVLDEAGSVSVAKLQPICFDALNKAYNKLGEVVGTAFKDGLALKK